jgi:hypothetical protein
MPTPVHETIQFSFMSAIAESQTDLPLSARLFCVTGQAMRGFRGQYLGSTKTADLAVQITNAKGQYETKMVVEIGFSEEYEALIKDARLWLEGMSSVSLYVLVSFEEEPRYRCPVDNNMDEEEFKKLGFPDPWELKPEHFHLKGPFGPAIYKGLDDEELGDEELGDEELGDEEPDSEELVWAGNISTAFLERWKRDKAGKAKKNGQRIVSYMLLMRISLTNWYRIFLPLAASSSNGATLWTSRETVTMTVLYRLTVRVSASPSR